MSSTDERKIPKIVLKINRNELSHSSNFTELEAQNETIYSTKAAELVKNFDFSGSIPFSSLVRRVNQNAYKSLENVLELMGRMNDVEKKKTLFQVISRIKDFYFKLQVILEWTKVSNEHLALKSIISSANLSKDNLNKLTGGLCHNLNNLAFKKNSVNDFNALKDLFISSDRVPAYFAPSIDALAPKQYVQISEADKVCWNSTLESILRHELSKNFVANPSKDIRLISIQDGKAKVLFSNMFEFEFTLVPSSDSEDSSSAAWFILGVQVDSMKDIFKNSLTGIFQFKFNNKSVSDVNYFKNILFDCSKYIELFYYEKIFSQFSFLSNFYGKSICFFQKGPQGDWFKVSPWFMADENICVSFTNDSGFKVTNSKIEIFPTLSFNEDEAQNIFKQLFSNVFMSRLEVYLHELKSKEYIVDFMINSGEDFSVGISLFEGFRIKIDINPFLKKFKFVYIDGIEVLDLNHLNSELETSILKFDLESFLEISSELLRNIFVRFILRNHSEFSIISCPEISSKQHYEDKLSRHFLGKTGICLQLRDRPTSAFTISLNSKTNFIETKFLLVSLSFQNALVDIKFTEIESDLDCKVLNVPKTQKALSELIFQQMSASLNISSKYSFESILKKCEIEGEPDSNEPHAFKIFSFGLPNCVTKLSLIPTDRSEFIYGNLDFSKDSAVECSNLRVGPNDISVTIKILKSYIRFLTIWEQFNILHETKIELESLTPILKLKYQNISFTIDEEGNVFVLFNDQRLFDFESFIESESFSIYDFIDKLLEINSSNILKKETESSPDLTWLSDSFM